MRVLLDTNIWIYLAAHADAGALAAAAKAGDVEILVAPVAAYEAVKTNSEADLRRRVDLLVDPRWRHLMPEAYWETGEIVTAIRAHRPQWLLARPPLQDVEALYQDWQRATKGGFWDRLQHTTAREAGFVKTLHQPMLDEAREDFEVVRAAMREHDAHIWGTPLQDWLAELRLAGLQGPPTRVKAWRADAYNHWTELLLSHNVQPAPRDATHAHVDWLSSAVDFSAARSNKASWQAFWFVDVADYDMPREWIRWAFNLLQGASKLSGGTPGDNQLSSYLLSTDVLLTADKLLARIARR